MNDPNELEEALNAPLPPDDVVPTGGLDRATIEALGAAGRVSLAIPGTMVTGPTGEPVGMEQGRTVDNVEVVSIHITRAEANRLDIEDGDMPHVRIHNT